MRSLYHLFICAFIQLLLWSNNGAEAVGKIPKRKSPTASRTGVELDTDLYNVGTSKYIPNTPDVKAKEEANRIIFMAHWRITGPLTDGQLVQIAMDGFLDMLENVELYGTAVGKAAIPSVMTVFHWDHEIILASSQSNGLPLTYTTDNGIWPLVKTCILPATEKSSEAKCGEMSAAQLFVHLYPTVPINTKNIVSVTVEGNVENKRRNIKDTTMAYMTQKGIKVPCNPASGGGCADIVGPSKVIRREVPLGTAPAAYSKAGWTQSKIQDISYTLPGTKVKHA